MKLIVKLLAIITILFVSFSVSYAQLNAVAGNNISSDVKKIIEDYPNHFKNIIGELLIENPQSSDYSSLIKLNGAEDCTITKYSATKKDIYSWQALLLTTENFDEAKKKFRSLYTQINNLSVSGWHLIGVYESPEMEKKFTNVVFSFDPGNEAMKNLKVEIMIESEVMEWKIKLLVYGKERDDNEKGEAKEN
jgi:hypothetical protein